jgi:hypothetical protein
VLAFTLFTANSAFAQYGYARRYYPGNPYMPYGYGSVYPNGPGYNAGAYLQGSASVMNAYGNVINEQEQARVTREQANQAKIDTKRKAFDEMMYEKANTPTYTEALTKEKQQLLTRVMNFPVKSEITDGKSLNIMLPYLQDLSSRGAMGPQVPLPQSMVNMLNISGAGTSSVGMLRDGGHVEWPLGLQGKNQKSLDKLLPQAYDAAAKGTLTPKLMKDVRTEMKTMRETLRQQCRDDQIETSTYLRAIEFYNSLESSVNALERPDAKKQLAGAYSPRARNVQELVDFMSDNGLQFAPSSPGNESAYQVTHDAFVRYARNAESGGLQALNSPRGTPPPPKKY